MHKKQKNRDGSRKSRFHVETKYKDREIKRIEILVINPDFLHVETK